MKHRIRATFSPPAEYERAGATPETIEREAEGLSQISEQLRELVFAGNGFIVLGATLTIEITPAPLLPVRGQK